MNLNEYQLDFFSPFRFEAKSDFDHKTSALKPHSIRASEQYFKNKNPIRCRETASIFRFVQRRLNQTLSSAGVMCFSVL